MGGEVENIIIEGRHESIISKEDFDKVQKMLDEKSTKTYMNKMKRIGIPKSIWTKKLKCQCGSSFHRRIYHKNAYETTYGYVCYRRKQYGGYEIRKKRGLDISDACNIKMIAEWKLEIMYSVLIKFILENKKEIVGVITEKMNTSNNDKKIMNYKSFLNKIVSLSFDIEKEYFLDNFIYKILVSDNEFIWKLNEIDDEIMIRLFDTYNKKEVNIETYYPTINIKAKYK